VKGRFWGCGGVRDLPQRNIPKTFRSNSISIKNETETDQSSIPKATRLARNRIPFYFYFPFTLITRLDSLRVPNFLSL